MAGSIGVLRRAIAGGVTRGWSGKARGCLVMAAFDAKAIVACLFTPAPVGIVDGFWGHFCQLKRALICLSSESNNRQ